MNSIIGEGLIPSPVKFDRNTQDELIPVNPQNKTMALGMAFLVAAGICAVGLSGKPAPARSGDFANGRTSGVRQVPRRNTDSTAPSPQNVACLSRSIHPILSGEPSGMARRSASDPPSTGSLVLSDRKTGILPVMEDSASRLSANETTGWKPAGQDRRDACPPANLTVWGEPPVAAANRQAQAAGVPAISPSTTP